MKKRAEGSSAAGRGQRLLRGAVVACASVLVAAAVGLIPSRTPEVPAVEPASEPVPLVGIAAPDDQPAAPLAVALESFALCEAPESRARLFPLPLLGQSSTFVVSCRAGYELFSLDTAGGPSVLTRLARFAWKGGSPAGALSADLNADGATDFVFGVAPAAAVVHAPGAGAFLVRGRAQGGYDDAVALLETPVESVALVREGAASTPRVHVLSRSDLAAQTPSELLVFEAATPPHLLSRMRWGMSAHDLLEAQLSSDRPAEVLAIATPERRVQRLVRASDGATSLATVADLSGVEQLMPATAGTGVFARTARDVYKLIVRDGELLAQPWLSGVSVGPAQVVDLDRDGTPDLIGLTSSGASFTPGAAPEAPHDLALEGRRGEDVLALVLAGEPRALVLMASESQPRQLELIVLPRQPWPKTTVTKREERSLRDAPVLAEIALE